MSVPPHNLLEHCIGLLVEDTHADVVLLDVHGLPIAQHSIAGERAEFVRILRDWMRTLKLDPHHCLFCVLTDDRSALDLLAAPMKQQVLLWRCEPEQLRHELGLPPNTRIKARMIAEAGFLYARQAQPSAQDLKRATRMDLLLARRAELQRFKQERLQRAGLEAATLDEDVLREFSRMDRRHFQLLEDLIARLDMLIAMHVKNAPDNLGALPAPIRFKPGHPIG